MKLDPKNPPTRVKFMGHTGAAWSGKRLTVGRVYIVERWVDRGSHGHVWIRNDADILYSYSARGFKRE